VYVTGPSGTETTYMLGVAAAKPNLGGGYPLALVVFKYVQTIVQFYN